MIDTRINFTNEVQGLLRVFPSIREETLIKYGEKNLGIANAKLELERMIGRKSIFRDGLGFCYLLDGMKHSPSSACSFAALRQLIGDGPCHIDIARFPYDYIMFAGDELYLLLDFSNDGIYKLGYEKNRRHPDEESDMAPVPVIMLINRKTSSVPEYLLPDHCFFAPVRYEDFHIQGVNLVEHNKTEKPANKKSSRN